MIVVNYKVRLDLVLNAPEGFLNQSLMDAFIGKCIDELKTLAKGS